jgi:hypothetical protein
VVRWLMILALAGACGGKGRDEAAAEASGPAAPYAGGRVWFGWPVPAAAVVTEYRRDRKGQESAISYELTTNRRDGDQVDVTLRGFKPLDRGGHRLFSPDLYPEIQADLPVPLTARRAAERGSLQFAVERDGKLAGPVLSGDIAPDGSVPPEFTELWLPWAGLVAAIGELPAAGQTLQRTIADHPVEVTTLGAGDYQGSIKVRMVTARAQPLTITVDLDPITLQPHRVNTEAEAPAWRVDQAFRWIGAGPPPAGATPAQLRIRQEAQGVRVELSAGQGRPARSWLLPATPVPPDWNVLQVELDRRDPSGRLDVLVRESPRPTPDWALPILGGRESVWCLPDMSNCRGM